MSGSAGMMLASQPDIAATPLPGRDDGPIGRHPRIVALGDSVTVGVGDAEERGWVTHLADVLGGSVANLAVNGARARTVVADQLGPALALAPDLVTVMVGGNDVLRGDFDAAEIEAALEKTLVALLATDCCVLLVIPPPVGRALPAPQLVRRVLSRRMSLVRAVTLAAAQRAWVPGRLSVIDSDDVHQRGGDRVFHIDRIHPSPLGHRLLAEQAAEVLQQRGFRCVASVSAVPEPPPLGARVWWLLVRGAPWLLRRSRDLLPELLLAVVREEWGGRRARRNARPAVSGQPWPSPRARGDRGAPAPEVSRRVPSHPVPR